MKNPNLEERKPGRSFEDPSRALGDDLITRGDPLSGDPEEGVYGRVSDHPSFGHGVAERAKAVAVLRKADELMREGNPPGDTPVNRRRALELSAGRCGVTMKEYDRYLNGDEELQALQATVMEDARIRAGGQ